MTEYLRFDQKIELENRYNIHILKISREGNKWSKYKINETAFDIISLINGQNQYDEILEYLVNKYNEKFDLVKEKVDSFINELINIYKLNIIYSNYRSDNDVLITQNKYPKAASIELTNNCNLRCRHCYGNYGDIDIREMSFYDVKKILDQLNVIGVEVVELTGGDITMHTQLYEIIAYALSLDFDNICLLTNGILLNKKILNLVKKNKDRISIQIDLHSFHDEYMEWFTQVPNTVDKIINNIKFMSDNKIRQRVAVMVTPNNLSELEDIAKWVHSLNHTSLGIGLVCNLGRASQNDKLILSEEQLVELNDIVLKLNNRYPNLVQFIESYENELNNCGAISNAISINTSGNIKICSMDTGNYFNIKLGNLLDHSMENIYNENMEFICAIRDLKAPDLLTEECKGCDHIAFCGKCLLRSFKQAKEMQGNCRWYNDCVPEVIKNQLSLI